MTAVAKRTLRERLAKQGTLPEQDTLLTRAEKAAQLKVSESTLERWAALGIGPPVVRLGGRTIRYRAVDARPDEAA